ncbi:response regulator transcription factor [Bacillus sp. FJAT-28004]|uniref:response regulator transcription factor n=1 Tax=Bacillus sp. FJAT-28004 TaxID=1679165 RepID=UPI0006B64AB2|nr:response regulator [Bacillus sp. FJAT-28004]
MFNVLIVDDEKFERDGIKYLLSNYNFNVSVAEAHNGKEALDYLLHHEVDVLITDIRMPIMDGIGLVNSLRKHDQSLKIVISSAYGEFEYAKKAIELGVEHYILKPVDIEEFIDVIRKVFSSCEAGRMENEKREKLLAGYNRSIKYEKEKIMLDLIQGASADVPMMTRMQQSDFDYQYKCFQLILIQMNFKIFDSMAYRLEIDLRTMIQTPYDFVNLNEYQSVILLKSHHMLAYSELLEIGNRMQQFFTSKDLIAAWIVFGRSVNKIEDLHDIYADMETMLDYHLFGHEKGSLLFVDQFYDKEEHSTSILNRDLEEIKGMVRFRNLKEGKRRISLFFDELQESNHFSSIYVKHLCVEIIKEICLIYPIHAHKFQSVIRDVYLIRTPADIKKILYALLDNEDTNTTSDNIDQNRKVIKEVVDLIAKQYNQEISLDTIASGVHLSPSYLSHLFKKETGENIVKYITSIRLRKASDYLRNTNMKIVDISKEVGFSNVPYFYTIFKNYYGLTPAKYRERVE